ncbi:MAG: hypothetical protein NTU79_17750 [Planctomycetota bacterium]|nr:hypothetical protein [Planctomycetota bacterium]
MLLSRIDGTAYGQIREKQKADKAGMEDVQAISAVLKAVRMQKEAKVEPANAVDAEASANSESIQTSDSRDDNPCT